jgi:hypothetical protein
MLARVAPSPNEDICQGDSPDKMRQLPVEQSGLGMGSLCGTHTGYLDLTHTVPALNSAPYHRVSQRGGPLSTAWWPHHSAAVTFTTFIPSTMGHS